ncbi:MAG: PucR family transcriptional regulator [Solirubrobacterales bacterium]
MLELPAVRRGAPEVVAGREQLSREVRWAHSGEVPNIADLLKGGELLLTTGMGIGRDPSRQRRFIAELASRGVAAIAIELGTTLPRIPVAMSRAAEREGMPLLALHREVRFVEITEAVHRELIDQGSELRRRADALHRRFTELLLRGATIPDVLTELSRFLANPVVLEQAGLGVAYHARFEAGDSEVLAAWTSFSRGLEPGPEAFAARVPMGEGETWGRLVVLGVDSPLDEYARVALERAVGLTALALMRGREEQELALRERGDFLAGLASSHEGEAELRQRARELGFDAPGSPLLAVAATRSPLATPARDGARGWQLARSEAQANLEARGLTLLAGDGPEPGSTLLVIALADAAERTVVADQVAVALGDACEQQLGDRSAAVICVGPISDGWLEAGAALSAAVDALPASAHGDARPWHDVSSGSPDRLLWALRDRPELRRYAELRLRPLLDRDAAATNPLLPTLATYCANGGRKAETARALHIERQSLYHRLARIEAILGVDLADSETVLALHLAVRASRYLDLETARR